MSKQEKKQQPEPAQAPAPVLSGRTLACAGCAALFVVLAIVGIIGAAIWDAKDSRLFNGRPLPKNVAYIGCWVSDKTIGARIDTFAFAGDKIACDFAVRNDSQQPVTVNAIGRTIIGPPLDARMSEEELPLNLVPGDQPMRVTDDQNVLGLQLVAGGNWAIIEPVEAQDAPKAEPFTLKPGEMKRIRYRPMAHQLLMPASALRIAVQLDDGNPPHVFYFLRKSAGIGGLMERMMGTAVVRGAARR
jgi:hypothetical protein